jgi:hypothetical protein
MPVTPCALKHAWRAEWREMRSRSPLYDLTLITAEGYAITLMDAVALTAALNSMGTVSLASAGALNVSGTIHTTLTAVTTGADSITTLGTTSVGKIGVGNQSLRARDRDVYVVGDRDGTRRGNYHAQFSHHRQWQHRRGDPRALTVPR